MEAMLGQAEASASMMPLLGIGRDVPEGRLRLQQRRNRRPLLDVDWRPKYSGPYFRRLRNYMQAIARELGSQHMLDPLKVFGRSITVHPLGGCPMGQNPSTGVVDSYGEVFNYPGLYIADGSIMPGPVGVNPSLTIAALADRCASQILQQYDKRSAHYVCTAIG